MFWYEILFIVSGSTFLIQFLCSIFFGDLDIDLSGDFDVEDLFSFKGILHFLVGYSAVLTLWDSTSLGIQFLAIAVGIALVALLSWVYKFVQTKLTSEILYTQEIKEAVGRIEWYNANTGNGSVVVMLNEGAISIPFVSEQKYKTGDIVKVSGNCQEVTIIN